MTIKGLSIDPDVQQTNTDTLGGSYVKNTGLYGVIVDMAYLAKSPAGATGLNLHFKVASDKSIIRQTLWVTSGDAKGNKNYYTTSEGKKKLLPGMAQADQIARITTGKAMSELTIEEKVINLRDFAAQVDKPTKVEALTEMIGKPLLVGLIKVRSNRMVKDGKGGYNKLPTERVYNEIDKLFYPDGASITEKAAGADSVFHKQWQEKYTASFVRDEFDNTVAGAASTEDGVKAAASTTGSLFAE